VSDLKGTVYLVNSDPGASRRIASLLKEENYDVRVFASANDALNELAPPGASVMIIDNSLDDMSGVSLIKELHDRGLQIPTLMTTDTSNIPNAVSALREGVIDVLEHPLNDQRLTQSIQQALKSTGKGR